MKTKNILDEIKNVEIADYLEGHHDMSVSLTMQNNSFNKIKHTRRDK